MVRFLKRLACFLAIQCVIVVVIVKHGAPQQSESYLCAVYDKLELLESTKAPRILLVGGSNVAFGINSALIQEQTGLRPVNLGLHAGLGLAVHLRLAEQHLREGDVVVLMLEYDLLSTDSIDGQAETIASFVESYPEGSKFFESTAASNGLKSFLDRDALRSAHQWVKRARCRIFSDKPSVYRRSGFNQYGDMVAHHGQRGSLVKTGRLPKASPQRLAQAVHILEQFTSVCRERGALVFLSFPPIPEATFQQSENEIKEIHVALEESLDIPIINIPSELVFPLDHFFDTQYHLNRVAADRRSRILANGLAQQPVFIAHAASGSSELK
jgi:hypothetical protein